MLKVDLAHPKIKAFSLGAIKTGSLFLVPQGFALIHFMESRFNLTFALQNIMQKAKHFLLISIFFV
jgi:hypothetical protein